MIYRAVMTSSHGPSVFRGQTILSIIIYQGCFSGTANTTFFTFGPKNRQNSFFFHKTNQTYFVNICKFRIFNKCKNSFLLSLLTVVSKKISGMAQGLFQVSSEALKQRAPYPPYPLNSQSSSQRLLLYQRSLDLRCATYIIFEIFFFYFKRECLKPSRGSQIYASQIFTDET